MFGLSIFAICLVSALAVNFVNCSYEAFRSKIDVKHLSDLLRANPDTQLEPLIRKVSYFGSSKYKFQLGYRQTGK